MVLLCSNDNKTTVQITLPDGNVETVQANSSLEVETIQTGFNGGQCQGVWYDVYWTHTYPAHPGNPNQVAVQNQCNTGDFVSVTGSSITSMTGAIDHIRYDLAYNQPGIGNTISLRIYRVDGSFVQIYAGSGGICADPDKFSASITKVVRLDGLPDNCGGTAKFKIIVKDGSQIIYESAEFNEAPTYIFNCGDGSSEISQPFAEQSLPLAIIPEFKATIGFDNIILENGSGVEQRIPKLTEYQLKADLSNIVLTESEANEILNFFKARKGKYEGFRFKFWADYWASHIPEYYDNNVYAQGITKSDTTFTQYQLIKRYTVGNVNSYKTITKPITSTIQVFVDGSQVMGGFSVNSTTGIVVFTIPLTSSNVVTWSGEFELPVRFDRDTLPKLLLLKKDESTTNAKSFNKQPISYYSFDSLPIIEEIKDRVLIESHQDFVEITELFNLSYIPETTETSGLMTQELELYNHNIHRRNRGSEKLTTDFSEIILNSKDAKYLLTWYIVTNGNLLKFSYKNLNNQLKKGRFNNSEINIEPILKGDDFTLSFKNISIYDLPTTIQLVSNNDLNSEVLTYSRCIRIIRKDGMILGFTTHDKNINIGGVIYRAREAVNPTNIEQKWDLSTNNAEIESILSSGTIKDGDIIAGKYDDAKVEIFLLNFTDLPVQIEDSINIHRGLVGEVSTDGFGYTFEVLSKASTLLNRKASKKVSPVCPYRFGDSDCGVNLAPYTYSVNVVEVVDGSTFKIDGTIPDGNLNYGKANFTSGLNSNLDSFILSYTANQIKLFTGMPYIIQVGDTLIVVQGCAKTPTDCKGYNNYLRFGGFPTGGNFMPGNDFLLNPRS
jgi:uncharacterized phage protein (TIGR02218 family)/uncharacterized protein (TIGR02217 family)